MLQRIIHLKGVGVGKFLKLGVLTRMIGLWGTWFTTPERFMQLNPSHESLHRERPVPVRTGTGSVQNLVVEMI